jgi:hypothetical protein
MDRKAGLNRDDGDDSDQLFLLRQTRGAKFWGGEEWVADADAARRYSSVETALTVARTQCRAAVSLLVVFAREPGHLIIPLEQSFGE